MPHPEGTWKRSIPQAIEPEILRFGCGQRSE
jgi:hypothetical protein